MHEHSEGIPGDMQTDEGIRQDAVLATEVIYQPHCLYCILTDANPTLYSPGMPSLRSCIPGYGMADILADVKFPAPSVDTENNRRAVLPYPDKKSSAGAELNPFILTHQQLITVRAVRSNLGFC